MSLYSNFVPTICLTFSPTAIAVLWLIIVVALLIVEAATTGLVSIWFAIGAVVALISSLFHAPFWLQVLLFIAVSVILLCCTRKWADKYVNSKVKPTNADTVIGKECVVTELIDNVVGTGAVCVDGKVWTARSIDPSVKIPIGSLVTAQRIEGVKLFVSLNAKPTEKHESHVGARTSPTVGSNSSDISVPSDGMKCKSEPSASSEREDNINDASEHSADAECGHEQTDEPTWIQVNKPCDDIVESP